MEYKSDPHLGGGGDIYAYLYKDTMPVVSLNWVGKVYVALNSYILGREVT